MAFGAILLIGTIRFVAKGWVNEFYVKPKFHFPFYGFEWVHPLPPAGMHFVFACMILTSAFIIAGLFYRLSVAAFLFCFTYVELIDKSYYLNHYYFVSLFTFLLLFAPAHRYFSLDIRRRPSLRTEKVPSWTILMFQAQLCLVYFFAGLSKLTPDWMLDAMPLRIWLPANTGIPVLGPLLGQAWIAYVFSWCGALFDLSIGPLLWWKPSRKAAYGVVILFHLVTALLFKIGMFPYIMIAATVIFFSEDWHRRLLRALGDRAPLKAAAVLQHAEVPAIPRQRNSPAIRILCIFFLLQILVPMRFLLYPGHLFWTEEGYRFSWRVMLMEKSGTDFFYVKDPATGRRGEIINSRYLTPFQERQMATQPDMILQYAHFLRDVYRRQGIADPVVTVQSYVTLNGSGSRLFIDSTVDLAQQTENFSHKTWILPFIKQP
jgi:Vitamin K-dependent gamma-carboxylase